MSIGSISLNLQNYFKSYNMNHEQNHQNKPYSIIITQSQAIKEGEDRRRGHERSSQSKNESE
ncbi:ubiquitin protein [Sesbania bispinosa]|nr:ubiquitin protein [Sesbania bispinosa]